MEWLARLRKRSIKTTLVTFILFLAIAIALFIFPGTYGVFGMLFPKTLADLTPENIEGAYVSDDIYFLYGEFIEVEQYKNNRPTGTITSRYYVTDFDETYYIALRVYRGDLNKSEDMMDACEAYMNYETDDLPEPLHVRGTIRAMDDEELRYYHRAAGYDEETVAIMLPYYIDMGRVNDMSMPILLIFVALTLVFLGLAIVPMVKACTGGCQKQVREMLSATGSLEMGLEQAAAFYDNTEPVSGFRMGREFVYFEQGPDSVLLRPWDIAWAYQKTTKHTRNGIPTGTSYAIILRLMNGKSYEISQSKKQVEELLNAMADALPGTVLGYSKEIESLYNQQRQAFSARWEEEVPGSTGTKTDS